MYRVLLVDDEPLILSGVKFLIDWEKNDCILAGTAKNGAQALELIDELKPDIVITDINMPIMNGIELLRHTQENYPAIVFIMLTNLEEFDLAREAMRMKAADYLTKSMMEPQMLENSLTMAKKEAKTRGGFLHAEAAGYYLLENKRKLLTVASEHFISKNEISKHESAILAEHGILEGWACILIWFTAAESTAISNDSEEDTEITSWMNEIVENLAQNSFSNYLIQTRFKNKQRFLLLHWGKSIAENEKQAVIFAKRLSSASENIAGLKASVLYTDVFKKEDKRKECLKQLYDLDTYFYLNKTMLAGYHEIGTTVCNPLGLMGLPKKMEVELNSLSISGCNDIFTKAIHRISEIPHEKEEAIWICEEICDVLKRWFSERGDDIAINSIFQSYKEIEMLTARSQVICWLEKLKKEVLEWLKPLAEHRSDLVDKAKEYVRNNVDKRITLQDTASHVGVSLGYLSSLFKKQDGQNFIDYVNKSKVDRACELIREGGLRLNEISYMLGFENAYYFSKVFRRHVGVTPSEYQNELKNN